jgi:hypothetical protein
VFGVINLDGLDDDGPFYVLERFGTLAQAGLAPHLAAALLQEADARGEPASTGATCRSASRRSHPDREGGDAGSLT